MMVTFVFQCEKKALNRTRRALDVFTNNKALEFMFDQIKNIALSHHQGVMDMKTDMTLFEDYQIRRIYDEEAEIWWFSVIDIVQVLTQQPNQQTARKYWNKLKQRLTTEGSQLVTNCHQLKMTAAAADHYQHVKLDARIIMPNHIHGIIMLDTVVRAQQKEASCENG